MSNITCFTSYDIRGELPSQLNENIAYRIGRAYAEHLKTNTVVVGSDLRKTSLALKLAMTAGIIDGGAKVYDIGDVGTEEIYFATQHLGVDGGIAVTAGNNDKHYNGMKMVKSNAIPITSDTGLNAIKKLAESYQQDVVVSQLKHYSAQVQVTDNDLLAGTHSVKQLLLLQTKQYERVSCVNDYVLHLNEYIDISLFKPLKLVVNSGKGNAGHIIDAIELFFKHQNVPVQFIKLNHANDNGYIEDVSNPLTPENKEQTTHAILQHKADMGIAWVGDFDRCFLFDETGQYIEGYYIVGLLSQILLAKNKGAKIVHDPRLYWNTQDIVEAGNGKPVVSRTGHGYIQFRMRKEQAIYAGEMSSHHYFKDFGYSDSGMIPWLLVAEHLCKTKKTLSSEIKTRMAMFPCSGELSYQVKDPGSTIKAIFDHYDLLADNTEKFDGISMDFGNWRFNLRKSKTNTRLKLNVESRNDVTLMQEKTLEIEKLIMREH